MSRKRYTKAEDALIIKCVKEHPNNLIAGFRELSRQIDRTPKSISLRWYYISKHGNVGNVFFLLSSKVGIKNRKNTNSITRTVGATIWNKLLRILGK